MTIPVRGPVRQVGLLDERHAQAAQGCVSGDPGPGHSPAQHEEVEGLVAESAQALLPG